MNQHHLPVMGERKSRTMEENNRPAPVPQDTENNHNRPEGGEGKSRRRRGHRGGKKHQERRERQQQNAQRRQAEPEAAATAGEIPEREPEKASAPSPEKERNQKRQENRQKDSKDRKQERGNGGKQNKHQRNGKRQPDHFLQRDDIYGDPQEEKELAEWRAKIVLNATENSTPVTPVVNTDIKVEASVDTPVSEPVSDIDSPDEASASLQTDTPEETESAEKVEVVGIRFRSAGKVYYFDPCGMHPQKGEFAIVETARGPEFGDVCMENTMVNVSDTVMPLRPLIRIATPADVEHNAQNREKEKDALVICQKKIAEHKLDMKLIDVQYAFDNSKLLFYFSSEGRVDFRELVKDLASVFRTRIELRQIGIRDEAKMLGGFGSCGRVLCCSTFLPDFAQVSIKMAKEQGLSLNSAKISGMCGRLMCCLRFESEVYAEEIKRTPAVDSTVQTEDGVGTVISTNPLAGTIRVLLKDLPDAPPKQFHRSQVTVLGKGNRNPDSKNDEKHG